MPNRGVKRAASKAEPKSNAGSSKIKKKAAAAAKAIEEVTALSKLGQVLACGTGDVGQLGLGDNVLEKSRFTVVTSLGSNIVDICAGGMHTVCVDNNGDVWTFGCNDEGALGRDTTDDSTNEWIPIKIKLPGKTTRVSAGDSHTAALLHTGQVYAWGSFRDSHGNMGLSLKGNERIPVEMLPGHKVIQIASGGDHLVMLTDNGQVYTCGCAEQGQLGRVTARSCDRNSRLGLNPLLIPAPLIFRPRDKTDFDMIWAGTHCTFAREASKGDIYAWGLNNYEQIGVRKGKPSTVFAPVISEAFSAVKGITWSKIMGGPHHTLALDSEGVCYALGRREYGRLGLGENCEDALELTPVPFLQDKKCTQIACGTAASFAVTDTGDIYAWGMGSSGQLGTGDENDAEVPQLLKSKQVEGRFALNVSAGGQHTILLVASIEQPTDKIKETEKSIKSAESLPLATEKSAEVDKKMDVEEENADAKSDAEKMDTETETEVKKVEETVAAKKPGRRGRKGSVSSTASSESTRSAKASKNKQNGSLKTVEESNNMESADTESKDVAEKDVVADAVGTQNDESCPKPSSQKSKREEPENEEKSVKRLKIDNSESVDTNKMEVNTEEDADVEAPKETTESVAVVNSSHNVESESLTNGNKDMDIVKSTSDETVASDAESKTVVDDAVADVNCASSETPPSKTEDVTRMETETTS